MFPVKIFLTWIDGNRIVVLLNNNLKVQSKFKAVKLDQKLQILDKNTLPCILFSKIAALFYCLMERFTETFFSLGVSSTKSTSLMAGSSSESTAGLWKVTTTI